MDHLVPVLVAQLGHVHAECGEEVERVARRHRPFGKRGPQGHRFRLAVALAQQLRFEQIEIAQLLRRLERGMIGDIVGGTDEIVESENHRAVSRLDELGSDTTFHRILYDDAQMQPDDKTKLVPDDKIRRVILCAGKVYYDLYDEREKRGIDDVYIMRVEQLYPVPLKALVQELGRFKGAEVVWCQEEPRNMGSWHFIEPYLEWVLNQIHAPNRRPRYAGRAASAATATGLMSKHLAQLKALLDEALN